MPAVSAPPTRHPVTATLAMLASLDPWLRASATRPPDAMSLERLTVDPDAIARSLARLSRRWDSDDRAVLGTFLLHDVAWRLAGPASAAFLATGRVLELDPKTVAYTFAGSGVSTGVAFLGRRCWSRPEDPDSGHPDVSVVDHPTLVPLLRDQLCGALDGFVAALRPWARRSFRIRWELVSDAVVAATRWAGQALGDDARGVQLGTDLLAEDSPLPGPTAWTPVTAAGRTELFRTRTACCLAYRLTGHDYCDTCPLTDPKERIERWRTSLAAAPQRDIDDD